ncbi:MAG: hypothetical protein U5Q44_06245 [Dehalococcoidia bacterium]|nr:hypothetical protein [Dehalococcoidia bacterium]
MKTDFYEADPFGGGKGDHLCTIETEYRWEKGDEVWVHAGGRDLKLRVTWVNIHVQEDGTITRELLGLKL